jgi:hypothetical protein
MTLHTSIVFFAATARRDLIERKQRASDFSPLRANTYVQSRRTARSKVDYDVRGSRGSA